MNEKSPRRVPLELSAEQLDYKESKARSENKRARNRLHINKETLSNHENTNVSSLDYEMRRLKHELRGIKQTSGYFVLNHETADDNMKLRNRNRRRNKIKISRRQSVTKATESISEVGMNSTGYQSAVKTISLPTLPTISSASSDSSAKNSSKSQEYVNNTQDVDILDTNSRASAVTLDSKAKSNSNNTTLTYSNEVLNSTTNDEIAALSTTNESEKTFYLDFKDPNTSDNLLGANVQAARHRVQNRLAVGHESTFQVEDDGDLTPYMHVPPDGLPRTAYLLPPLEDLLCEARKARYIRKLRKRDTVLEKDDPERELNIDEIFSKSR